MTDEQTEPQEDGEQTEEQPQEGHPAGETWSDEDRDPNADHPYAGKQ